MNHHDSTDQPDQPDQPDQVDEVDQVALRSHSSSDPGRWSTRALLVAAALLAVLGVLLLLGVGTQLVDEDPESDGRAEHPSEQQRDGDLGDPTQPTSSGTPAAGGTSPEGAPEGSSVPLDLEDPALLDALEQRWRPVAEGFARDHATPGDDWYQRVSRWTAEHLDEELSYTSPLNVRAADLVDVEADEIGDIQVTATATYGNGEQLHMILTVPGGGDGNYYVTRFVRSLVLY